MDDHFHFGVALQDKGDLEGAIAEYRAALHLNPNHVSAHEGLGTALHSKGDLRKQSPNTVPPCVLAPTTDLPITIQLPHYIRRVTWYRHGRSIRKPSC